MAGMFEQIKQITQMRREGKRIQAEIQRVTATYTNGGISATARGDFNITALTITDEALEELKAGKTARFVTMLQNVINGAIKNVRTQTQEMMEKSIKSGGIDIDSIMKQFK